MKKICVLNYGSGNVKSVYNMISFLKHQVIVSNDFNDIESSSHIILPGVGSFGSAMKKIKANIPLDSLKLEILDKKKPFLGICVGMQVLAEKGYENGEHQGLGWVSGVANKLEVKNFPLPHIGWNDVIVKKESQLFKGLKEIKDFYFVHSYKLVTDENYILTETNYEVNFCSSIQKDNIYGVQFHPEKSQKAGQKIIQNFLNI